ncbi:MAG: serine/threonine protein kinase [Bacteriovoracaceae bacterium]|nr:serine/threonine protein kinase [Bacteriovoracaceae bacterium]
MSSVSTPWGGPTQFFYALTPDVIDQVLRDHGLRPLGRVMALNSLENRVYDVEVAPIEVPEGPFAPDAVVVKFYRPGRWSQETLQEEHRFLAELNQYEIPVVSPIEKNGETLFLHQESSLLYTVFPKVRGRLKDELDKEESKQIGRLIGRLHNIGQLNTFKARHTLNTDAWLLGNLESIEAMDFVPEDIKKSYRFMAQQLHGLITPMLKALPVQRIHGDFHRGNVLWTNQGAWITDLDDCVMGPRQQDLWLLFPGRDEWSQNMREEFLSGYHEMSREPIHLSPLLIEALRTMRLVHFNGWISKRWEDPVFKQMFSTFQDRNYWEQQLLDLKEQMGLLQDHHNSGTGFGY